MSPLFCSSLSSPSYDSSIASTKASPPYSVNYYFLFQFLRSSAFFKVIQQLLIPSSSSFRPFYISFYLCFNNLFQKATPMQCVTNRVNLHLFIVYEMFLSSLTLYNSSSFFTRSVQLILLNAVFSMTILELISRVCLLFSLSRYQNSLNIPHFLLHLIYHNMQWG